MLISASHVDKPEVPYLLFITLNLDSSFPHPLALFCLVLILEDKAVLLFFTESHIKYVIVSVPVSVSVFSVCESRIRTRVWARTSTKV